MRLVDIKEAKGILNVSATTVRQMIAGDETFPAYKVGRQWRIDADALLTWLIESKPKYEEEQIQKSYEARHKPRPRYKKKEKKEYKVITPGWNPETKQVI